MEEDLIIGVDEVGRGALAGPVVAVALTIENKKVEIFLKKKLKKLNLLKDSKQLSPKKREKIVSFLKKTKKVIWAEGRVYPNLIDRINILEATKLAMERAINNLLKKTKNKKISLILIDGNLTLNIPFTQKAIIKGDEKIFLIKLASIVAKVSRDNLMRRYQKIFPAYQFNLNKGYGTKYHFLALKKFGLVKIHRSSFKILK